MDLSSSSASHNGKVYTLVTGEHRLEACLSLDWTEIPSIVLSLSDIDRELWHIDENLCRAELSELERAEHLKERKALYLVKHPETKRYVAGAHASNHKQGNASDNLSLASFAEDTASKTGLDKRTVERSIRRAESISPEVKEAIADMPEIADKGVELDALARMPAAEQKRAVEAVKSGAAASVRQVAALTPQQDVVDSDQSHRLRSLYSAAMELIRLCAVEVEIRREAKDGWYALAPGDLATFIANNTPRELLEGREFLSQLSQELAPKRKQG